MNSITILMYHQVGHFGRVDAHRAVYCDAGAFRRQMAFLRAGRYNVLTLDEVLACVSGAKAIPPRAVHLTFDDGYTNYATEALPAMRRHRLASSVFLVTDLLGKDAAWLPPEGLPAAPLLDSAAARAFDGPASVAGSHTATHPHLSHLDADALQREIAGSRATLETALGRPVDAFCYPYGDLNRAALEAARRANYRIAFTCERNRAVAGQDPLLLPRHAVSYGTSLVGLFWKLHIQKPGKPLDLG